MSGSKWVSPDNKFIWCPSGTYLLPNVTYINAQGGVNVNNIHLALQITISPTNRSAKYLDVIPGAQSIVFCEQY
jgi:hypothetical protein